MLQVSRDSLGLPCRPCLAQPQATLGGSSHRLWGISQLACGGFPSWPCVRCISHRILSIVGCFRTVFQLMREEKMQKKLLFEFWSSPSKLFTLGGKVGCSSLASTIESSLLFTVSNWWPRIFSSLAGHSHAGRLQNALLQ